MNTNGSTSSVLFGPPELDDRELTIVAEIEELKHKLRLQLHEPRRWSGSLRRLSFARNIQGSNSIEGFEAALDDAAAVALGQEPFDASTKTHLAIEGYRNAMTYVLQLVQEPKVDYSWHLLSSLHFMMTQHDLKNRPGRWRLGSVYVRKDETGEIVHEGADIDLVPDLVHELVATLNEERDQIPMVRAAMAHLNLVMIHPYRDGNGRMARCLQSLVLGAGGTLSPEFMSIEEYLGKNTQAYYEVLAEVGGGRWQPERSARAWIRFTLSAHLRQARVLRRCVNESEVMWDKLERLAQTHGFPERAIPMLFDAALGLRVRNATYRALSDDDDITEPTASRDLRQIVEAGLLVPHGEKRGRHYSRSKTLGAIRAEIIAARDPSDDSDPFG